MEENIDVERTYLQLVRFSGEIREDLSSKEKLISDSYKSYLIDAQDLIAKWQISTEKSKHLYTVEPPADDYVERVDQLKKKFVTNMQAVRVRLHYLNPENDKAARAKNLRKKIEHYAELKRKAEAGEKVARSLEEINSEIASAQMQMETLLKKSEG